MFWYFCTLRLRWIKKNFFLVSILLAYKFSKIYFTVKNYDDAKYTAVMRNRNVSHVRLEPYGECRLRKTDRGNDCGGGTCLCTSPRMKVALVVRLSSSCPFVRYRFPGEYGQKCRNGLFEKNHQCTYIIIPIQYCIC